MKILFVTYETIDSACPRYRAFWPAKGLQLSGHSARVLLLDECSKNDIDWADVVVFERIVEAMANEPDHYKRVQRARKIMRLWNYALLRKITGYDLDDYIFFSDDGFGFYNICTWLQKALMRHSNYVSTSSAFLASILSKYNKNVYQIDNCIDTMTIRDLPEARGAGERITLGWLCGQTHHRDEPMMLDILKSLIERYRHAIRFLFVGKISSKMLYLIDIYSSKIQIENYRNWQLLPALQQHIDINIVPLLPCTLNKGKSAISYLEAGYLKIPSVCSKIGEFPNIIKDGYNGFLAENLPQWLDKLGMLIEDENLRKGMGERAYQDVVSRYTVHVQGERYARLLATMALQPAGLRLKNSITANVYFLSRWLKVTFIYLISILRERFNIIRGRVIHLIKKHIKQVTIYLTAKRKKCFARPPYQRSWHVTGIEEQIFLGLDAINGNGRQIHNARRIVLEVYDISLCKRIEPFITIANWIAGKGLNVIIIAPKAIRHTLKPYVNPHVIMCQRPPKKTVREIHFTQEDCYAIMKKKTPVVVDPHVFSPLVINKKIGLKLGLYVGSKGDSGKVVGEICNYFNDRYGNIQLRVLNDVSTSIAFPHHNVSTVNYEGPECLAQFYSSVDAFLLLDEGAESFQLVLEAMSCGTPVISKPLDKNCFADGHNILFYNQNRGSSLCDLITTLLEDHFFREHVISEGHNCAKQFNPSDMIKEFDRIINEKLGDENSIPVTV